MAAKTISCGVIVTDGQLILLGHATRSPRWDIPKGGVEPGESLAAAAVRELHEETGLVAPEHALQPLGTHAYLRNKDLALFRWIPPILPDPRRLVCATHFAIGDRQFPEFDRFALFSRDDALIRVGKNLARVLSEISWQLPSGASG